MAQIILDLDVADSEALEDIIVVLERMLPYMADNVMIRSRR